MKNPIELLSISLVVMLLTQLTTAAPDENFHCFLLFGQSNMAGGCKDPNPGDCDLNARIQVLSYTDCQGSSPACSQIPMNWTKNQWRIAAPPYHDCDEGIGIADNFAKTLLDNVSKENNDISIGLIPCALSGMSMGVFRKGAQWGEVANGDTMQIPNWCQKDLNSTQRLAYDWMIERCMIAQTSGVIKGILIHQGETDNGDDWWVDTTKKILDDLKADLNLPSDIPVIVGELLQETDINGKQPCCTDHIAKVHQLSEEYDHCDYVSSESLKMRTDDTYGAHFDCVGFKEFGIRYALKYIEMTTIENISVPRSIKSTTINNGVVDVFSLNGKKIFSSQYENITAKSNMLKSGKLYLIRSHASGKCSRFITF